jgi:hypothetical protein
MRRPWLALVAIAAALSFSPPEPAQAGRNILSFLGLRIGGHHARHHHRYRHTRWARASKRTKVAKASAAAAAGTAAAAGVAGAAAAAAAANAGAPGVGPAAGAPVGTAGLPPEAGAADTPGTAGSPPAAAASAGAPNAAATASPPAAPAAASAPPSTRPARVATAPVPRGEDVTGPAIPINLLYWPQAYYELLGSTFAIGDKDRFWSHGLNDFYTGMVGPAGTAPSKRRAAAEAEPQAAGACAPARAPDPEAGPAGTTFRQIEKRVAPTAEQRAAFDALQAAMIKAEQRIYSGCWQPYPSQSPPERLKTIADKLWALRQAMLMLRTPLEQVLGTLSDAQKAKLDGKGPLKITCPDPSINEASWTGERVEEVLQLNDEQRASLEALRLVSIHLGQSIGASCPSQPFATPLQRLDAIGDRLNTMLYGAMIVSRSFNNFYASLNDEQKARFRTLARSLPPPRRSADVGTP